MKNTGKIRKIKKFITEKAVWAVFGALLELGSAGSAAPGASALFAGVSGEKAWFVLAGGLIGAALCGFPAALTGAAALAITVAARFIPDLDSPKLRVGIRVFAGVMSGFFSRAAEQAGPLSAAKAAVLAGIFAGTVCLLEGSAAVRGFDVLRTRDRVLFSIISALAFTSLGGIDLPVINAGRLIFGASLMIFSARKGAVWSGAFAVSGVFGLSLADFGLVPGAALIAFSALLSRFFEKYGKLGKAAGFVFGAAFLTLLSGADNESLRSALEALMGGAVFLAVPVGFYRASSADEFKDSAAALILRERLEFAADALKGVETGAEAAAEALERKYGANAENVADLAAQRACRNCPMSMKCWGENYELFSGEFKRLVEQLRTGFALTEFSLNGKAAEICVNPSAVSAAVEREYSKYLSASRDERRIAEIRRIYMDRLESTREILTDLARTRDGTRADRNAERRAERLLFEAGMKKPRAFVTLGKRGRLHFEAYGETEPSVEPEYLGELLSRTLGRELDKPEISGARGNFRITANEASALNATIGACQLPRGKNHVCGDCYETFTDAAGIFYVVLSDGMGSGSRARIDSAMACSIAAKLIKGGISLSAALETINTVMLIKSADESFTTLDICRIDLNSGECAVYKAGAAATYIRSSDKLIRAAVSSPPAGCGGRFPVPAQRFNVTRGDVIIMTTDGAILDENWLSRELSAFSSSEPGELSERIARAARCAEGGADDDISVIAVAVS